MKKFRIILAAFIFLQCDANAQVKKFSDLVGRWEITGEELPGASLEIIDSSSMYLTYMGEKKKITGYSLDLTKSPAWFDFTLPDSSGILHVKSIVQVYGDNVMKWQLFLEEERSAYFTASRGEMMYLKKTKPVTTAVASSQ